MTMFHTNQNVSKINDTNFFNFVNDYMYNNEPQKYADLYTLWKLNSDYKDEWNFYLSNNAVNNNCASNNSSENNNASNNASNNANNINNNNNNNAGIINRNNNNNNNNSNNSINSNNNDSNKVNNINNSNNDSDSDLDNKADKASNMIYIPNINKLYSDFESCFKNKNISLLFGFRESKTPPIIKLIQDIYRLVPCNIINECIKIQKIKFSYNNENEYVYIIHKKHLNNKRQLKSGKIGKEWEYVYMGKRNDVLKYIPININFDSLIYYDIDNNNNNNAIFYDNIPFIFNDCCKIRCFLSKKRKKNEKKKKERQNKIKESILKLINNKSNIYSILPYYFDNNNKIELIFFVKNNINMNKMHIIVTRLINNEYNIVESLAFNVKNYEKIIRLSGSYLLLNNIKNNNNIIKVPINVNNNNKIKNFIININELNLFLLKNNNNNSNNNNNNNNSNNNASNNVSNNCAGNINNITSNDVTTNNANAGDIINTRQHNGNTCQNNKFNQFINPNNPAIYEGYNLDACDIDAIIKESSEEFSLTKSGIIPNGYNAGIINSEDSISFDSFYGGFNRNLYRYPD